jgi:CAAX prenyl protease-like protein
MLPFVAMTSLAILAAALSDGGSDLLYPLRVVAAGVALWTVRRRFAVPSAVDAPAASAASRAGSAVALLVGTLVFVLWVLLVPPPPADDGDALAAGLSTLPPVAAGVWMLVRLVGFVVTTPLVEELAFRGCLMRRLDAVEFERVPPQAVGWSAIAVSSLLFGAMHDWIVAGTVAGLGYALVYRRSGRLRDAVLAHATTNGLLAVLALSTGRWWLL